jgi:triosephosphate isomerase
MKKKLIAGNWKMNGSLAANEALVQGAPCGLGTPACDVAVAVPSPYLAQVQGLLPVSACALGGARMSRPLRWGPTPVRVSAAMLKDFGVRYALVGHSERRQYHGETDAVVAEKARQALAHPASRPSCVWAKLCKSVKLVRPSLWSSASWLP